MNNKIKVISIVLSFSVFMMLVSFGGQKAEWKGKIEVKNGVKVIKNPKDPIYREDVLSLEEEMSIGEDEGRPEYSFGQIAAIAVDEQGRLCVADDKNIHIKIFDKNGVFLRTIGRSGQGPGEIGRPYNVFINSRGELIVPDGKNYKLHFYSLDGKFLRDKSFGSRFPYQTVFGPQDQFFVLIFGGDFSTGTYFELSKLDEDLNPMAVLHRIDIPAGPLRESLSSKIPYFCARSDGSLVMGFAKQNEYLLMIITPQGHTSRIISRDFDPVPIPNEILEKAKESRPPEMKIKLPIHFPSFSRLIADDEGRIFALTIPVSSDKKSYLWDVFDAEGKYIAEVRLPGSEWHLATMKNGVLWKNRKLYVVEEDDDGYHIIKRYKVTWKY